MKQKDIRVWNLSRVPDAQLAVYIDAFAEWLDARCYKRRCIGQQLQFVARFGCWLRANHIRIDDVTDDHAKKFVVRRGATGPIPCGFSVAIYRFLGFLRERGVIAANPCVVNEPTHVQRIVNAYCQYLRADQGLSRATRVQYAPFIEQFLAGRFGAGTINLSALSAASVISVIRQQAGRLSPVRARCATIALRSFMRYLRYRGEITIDLAAAVPAVPNWSMTSIPRAMAADHVHAVLAACKRDTAVGCRDYAILMLLARLGLRSSEVVALTLDCIDWASTRRWISRLYVRSPCRGQEVHDE